MTQTTLTGFPTYEEIYNYLEKLELASPEMYANAIVHLTSPLREEFLNWWNTGEINKSVEVRGITLQSLIEELKWDVARAFVALASIHLQSHVNSQGIDMSKAAVFRRLHATQFARLLQRAHDKQDEEKEEEDYIISITRIE